MHFPHPSSFQGLAYMVGNPLTHGMLKVLIAKNKEALHDSSSVQLSFINLLLVARKIADFKVRYAPAPRTMVRPGLGLTSLHFVLGVQHCQSWRA